MHAILIKTLFTFHCYLGQIKGDCTCYFNIICSRKQNNIRNKETTFIEVNDEQLKYKHTHIYIYINNQEGVSID